MKTSMRDKLQKSVSIKQMREGLERQVKAKRDASLILKEQNEALYRDLIQKDQTAVETEKLHRN